MALTQADFEGIRGLVREELTGESFREFVRREVQAVLDTLGKEIISEVNFGKIVIRDTIADFRKDLGLDASPLVRLQMGTHSDMLDDHEERLNTLENNQDNEQRDNSHGDTGNTTPKATK